MYDINKVPFIDPMKSKTGCCTLIEPNEWDEEEFTFKDKMFVKAKVRSLFHIPMNMSSVMKEVQTKIHEAGAEPHEYLMLSFEKSPWISEQLIAVTKEVPGLETVRLSGTYLTKVFEGEFKDAPKWHESLIEYVKTLGKKPLSTYFFYTECPNCAKTYGKNYVVGFEQVA